ncbi:hypothetical protein [Nocardioides cavernaquae]|nr:hypothetical protein [Nocardioides cavernaquae]
MDLRIEIATLSERGGKTALLHEVCPAFMDASTPGASANRCGVPLLE